MKATVHELLRLCASPAGLLPLGPDLRISAVPMAAPTPCLEADAGEHGWLIRDGAAILRRGAEARVCAALVHAIEALSSRELPASFVYAFDEPWVIGEHLRDRTSRALGRDYVLVEDVWAWHIPPGSGGWPPHRGTSQFLLEREAPELLNVWVALSEVTADRACIHVVPLDEDPGYPDTLGSLDAPLASVRALPVNAGDALFWNANTLHWGGRCAPRAGGPRVSCSFTLCRADATERLGDLRLLPPVGTLTHAARMDVLARMILLYGGQQDIGGVVREWATVTHELASRFGARKAP